MATWTCVCGATATRAIQTAPVEVETGCDLIVPAADEAPWRFYTRIAQRVFTMENGDPAWARRQLRRALGVALVALFDRDHDAMRSLVGQM